MTKLYLILDILICPFRYLHHIATAPRRIAKRKKNWKKFVVENRDQIDHWMSSHGEENPLPVYRDDDEQFHWVTRASRRRAEARIRKKMMWPK